MEKNGFSERVTKPRKETGAGKTRGKQAKNEESQRMGAWKGKKEGE